MISPLPAGTPAPDFQLPSSTGGTISLSDYRGRPVILVFYPADHSPVCSNQLVLYNEAHTIFDEYQAQVLAISTDDIQSHQDFSKQFNLSFPLLSDSQPLGEVAGRYGVFNESDNLCERALFVVDGEGSIYWSYLAPRKQNPGAHGILNALETLP